MDTSLRYGKDSKHLHLHAKQKFILDEYSFLQIHGKLNTVTGAPHGCAQIKQRYCLHKYSFMDVGFNYNTEDNRVTLDMKGKNVLPVVESGLLHIDTKGGFNFDPISKQGALRGAMELTMDIQNFQEDQDLRFKVGCNLSEKKPYLQIRENCWTFNADINGRWNIKYDM